MEERPSICEVITSDNDESFMVFDFDNMTDYESNYIAEMVCGLYEGTVVWNTNVDTLNEYGLWLKIPDNIVLGDN